MRSYGKEISDQTIVTKMLRCLTSRFDHVVAAMESKELATYSFDELIGSLQSHEARLNRANEKSEEKGFQVIGKSSKQHDNTRKPTSRGRGRAGYCGRGDRGGQGRGRVDAQDEQEQITEKQKNYKSNIRCYYCKRYGHVMIDCWKREKQANYAEDEEEIKLFMAYQDNIIALSDIWFLDSGYSNHITGIKSLFKELDESHKLKLRVGDGKQMQVEGKGTVAINNGHDEFSKVKGCKSAKEI
ncbi:hypothetical protein ACH5RR_039763 [Cinchona calisaya]|uniref:Retrovirus-related Pol polyprotein from transposon TNT 1-94-like beta-barrel domain-containing protein n=1 Tax=Cinchona calisaya TaxID=153742 RepID=A0ABD2Y392_9GENT